MSYPDIAFDEFVTVRTSAGLSRVKVFGHSRLVE